MYPPASDSACVRGQECWAVTYGEKQCGCEHCRECQGCHNRKHRDITRPSGGTEADDGVWMRLNYPCGIWLRLAELIPPSEGGSDLSGSRCLHFVYQDWSKQQQRRAWFGGKSSVSAHSLASPPLPGACLVKAEGEPRDSATSTSCIPEHPSAGASCLKGLAYASYLVCASCVQHKTCLLWPRRGSLHWGL